MDLWYFGNIAKDCWITDSIPLPKPENDNWPVKAPWQTPPEVLQMIRRWKEEMRQELIADFALRSCPEHRHRWDLMHAMEKAALWVHYRMRKE